MSLLSVSVMPGRLAQHDLSVYLSNIYCPNIYCVNVYNAFFTEYACLPEAVFYRHPWRQAHRLCKRVEVLRSWFTARVLATSCSTYNVLD